MLRAGTAGGSEMVAQGFIQSGLENFQGWRLNNLSGLAAPLPAYSKAKVVQCWLLEGYQKPAAAKFRS